MAIYPLIVLVGSLLWLERDGGMGVSKPSSGIPSFKTELVLVHGTEQRKSNHDIVQYKRSSAGDRGRRGGHSLLFDGRWSYNFGWRLAAHVGFVSAVVCILDSITEWCGRYRWCHSNAKSMDFTSGECRLE